MAASAAVEMEAGGRGGKDGGGRDVDKWLREPALQRERLPCSSAASQIADFEVTHNCGKKASIFRHWNMGSIIYSIVYNQHVRGEKREKITQNHNTQSDTVFSSFSFTFNPAFAHRERI